MGPGDRAAQMLWRGPTRLDVALGLGMAAWALLLVWVLDPGADPAQRTAADLLATLPLVWRRVLPLPVLLTVVAAQTVAPWAAPVDDASLPVFLAAFVAMFAVGTRSSLPELVGGLVAVGACYLYGTWQAPETRALEAVAPLVVHVVVANVARALRRREGDVRRLETAAAVRELEQAQERRDAVRDERTRIARELHDVIAHGVSVMVVHAEAGQRLLEIEPERARRSLETIERVGRDSVEELHRLLAVLRSDGAPAAPPASLRHLEDVVGPVRETGVDVTVTVDADPDALPASVELCAYRVVQEALTNVVKHAAATSAIVRVAHDGDTVTVEVVDDGSGAGGADAGDAEGHGLRGMHERLRMLGGRLEAGNRPGGGFEVRAAIPVAP